MSREVELEKKIDAYVKGNLSEEESQELWKELLKNPEYIDLLETELGLNEMYKEKKSAAKPSDNSAAVYSINRSWKWMAAAASVAILVVAINFLQMNTNPPVNELAIEHIDLAKNLASAPVNRSEQQALSGEDSLLNLGVANSLNGKSQQAEQLFRKTITQYPDSPVSSKALLNLGISQYNSGDYREAIEAFSKASEAVSENSPMYERLYWFLGNAHIKTGELEKARNAIYQAYSTNGEYRDPAYKLLQKLDYEMRKNDAAQIN